MSALAPHDRQRGPPASDVTRRLSLGPMPASRILTKQAVKPATLTESVQLIKDFLSLAVGTLLSSRDLFHEECFEDRVYTAGSKVMGHTKVGAGETHLEWELFLIR
ncbi:unnamed protein product [Parajaminaea phylloscopi]